jgi:DNA-binding transcriptional LysR family regulator
MTAPPRDGKKRVRPSTEALASVLAGSSLARATGPKTPRGKGAPQALPVGKLEAFYHVATTGSFTAAAAAMNMSQPAVSQQLRRLEKELKVDLVGRNQLPVVPTRAGALLLTHIKAFFTGLPALLEGLQSGPLVGTVRVGTSPLELRHVLPTWAAALRAAHPEVVVEIEELVHVDLSRLTRDLDLIVEVLPTLPEGIAGRTVGEHRIFLVWPETWDVSTADVRKKRLPTTLLEAPVVAFHPSTDLHNLQIAALEAARQGSVATSEIRVAASATSTDGILALVAAGVGYSLVPWPTEYGPASPGVRAALVPGNDLRIPIVAAYAAGPVGEGPARLISAALSAFE